MALKKSQLYSTLWSSCDELRGGMDASQYKDYVLTLLFLKYVSDKYAGDPDGMIEVPSGGSFVDMVALKGDKEIGDKINKIIGRLAEANDLKGVIDQADFNDEDKLGKGKEMQDRLSKLVAIFSSLDFRGNRADGDDLLGDAYEYLMRHFATESGKSKGQFYTPAEVSRILARVVGLGTAARSDQTIYDPACGSGSLLLKAAEEAPADVTIYGQEKDLATWSLARMNMILHGHPTAELWRDNTLSAPYFKNPDGSLKRFDFAVVNPPFSDKGWTSGLDPVNDEFHRFDYGVPPAKNGDYAFLLHVIASLKSEGKGAVILPHGVLFRGNKESDIRKKLIKRGYIKGIIGLPANLFYGTGIPACIVVIDKKDAAGRMGIFMVDGSKGFIKDGNKNRLRSQDIHKIVDVFNRQLEVPRFSRMVPLSEIADSANDYNLNISRYIDSSEPEDLHDLEAHLRGGIPNRDIDGLDAYWSVFPSLRQELFEDAERSGYSRVTVEAVSIKNTILHHEEFKAYDLEAGSIYSGWKVKQRPLLNNLEADVLPKEVIKTLSEDLLKRFSKLPLINKYDIYQCVMDYWDEVMQDDLYLIAANGWQAGRVLRSAYDKETPEFTLKKGRKTIKYVGELIPTGLVIDRFFADKQQAADRLQAEVDEVASRKQEFEEEHGGDEGVLNGLEGARGISKGNVQEQVVKLKEMILEAYSAGTPEHKQAKAISKGSFATKEWQKGVQDEEELFNELDILYDYLQLFDKEKQSKDAHNLATKELHEAVVEKYPELTEEEIKELVIESKWFAALTVAIRAEVENISQGLAARIKELEERYAEPLPELEARVEVLSEKVAEHLKRMGLEWA